MNPITEWCDGVLTWLFDAFAAPLLLLFIIGASVVLIALLWGAFLSLMDHCKKEDGIKPGIVLRKEYQPEHTETIYIFNAATKTSMPHQVTHPERYMLYLQREEGFEVEKEDYEGIRTGETYPQEEM